MAGIGYLLAGPRVGGEQLAGLPGRPKPAMAAADSELDSATTDPALEDPEATVQAGAEPDRQQVAGAPTATALLPKASAPGDRETAPTVGALAPDFTLANLDGERISLSSLRGKVVLLNFWATW